MSGGRGLGVGLCLVGLAVLAGPAPAFEQPVSAFASNVGKRPSSDEPAPSVTLYVVPDGRALLLTDVLVANHGLEPGPLYLADSKRTLCSIELLQSTLMNNPTELHTLSNPHTTFSTGIPFGPGEPVVATLAGGTRGVDVTITGKLVAAPRVPRRVVLPGGKGGEDADEDGDRSPR
ncbi:MAG: hypothetical protein E6J79_15840 [Deltaproteobacteria bacterium]|nr:MAG: hypothetical protein E6J79_15840 [Deltaproteobacteria bacterium]